ncbi:MAG: hypothetical protein RLZZ546_233 [Bacteroidota bacterium]|jgi:hypothetical protein
METTIINQNNNVANSKDILAEIQKMLSFVYHKGIKIPENISKQSLTNDSSVNDTASLIADYNLLTAAILPSTPESIKFIGKEFMGTTDDLKAWQLPLVKKYIIMTIATLAVLIGVSLMPQVSAENQDKSILSLSGSTLFYNLVFICSASLLGVMFYILKTIKDKIDTFALIPVDVFSFNISIMIGIVAGFIISELFTFTNNVLGGSIEVHKMTLALLGGFASDAIFTILHSMVNKIKEFFSA